MNIYELYNEKKTLYVSRPVINTDDILAWAKEQGFPSTLASDDLHVTIAYSRRLVLWGNLSPDNTTITNTNGPRIITKLGGTGKALVLIFEDDALLKRWKTFRKIGCSWDHDVYRPHITITYNSSRLKPKKIKPYDGPIVLGPEKWEELNTSWNTEIVEVPLNESQSHDDAGDLWITDDGDIEDDQITAGATKENLGDLALETAYRSGWIHVSWNVGGTLCVEWHSDPSDKAKQEMLSFWKSGFSNGFDEYVIKSAVKADKTFDNKDEAYQYLVETLNKTPVNESPIRLSKSLEAVVSDFLTHYGHLRENGVQGNLGVWFGQYVGQRPSAVGNDFEVAPFFAALKVSDSNQYKIAVKKFYAAVMAELSP